MWALEQQWIPRQRAVIADTPFALLAILGSVWLAIVSLATRGWVPDELLRIATLTVIHGGPLAVALAWGQADGGGGLPRGALAITIVLAVGGAVAVTLGGPAAFALAGTPAWFAILAARGHLAGLGLGPGVPVRPMLVGATTGALLGVHVLYSASQMLGYPLRREGWLAVLVLWAYDVGANAISTECFFRGALFNRLQRRWSFSPAAAVATALSLVRYLCDPLLAGQVEVMVGALFYATIRGVVNSWLFWWSGSLVPGLVASAVFFLAYRALAIE